jgi:hypothetical protein
MERALVTNTKFSTARSVAREPAWVLSVEPFVESELVKNPHPLDALAWN